MGDHGDGLLTPSCGLVQEALVWSWTVFQDCLTVHWRTPQPVGWVSKMLRKGSLINVYCVEELARGRIGLLPVDEQQLEAGEQVPT